MTLLGIFLYTLGRKNTKLLLFPTFFLVFMFPLPESFFVRITGSLKLLITKASAVIINIAGI
ncbi:MAG: archaeosortase/exosortase family protein, partial [Candidatus Hodarchaeota archaeon]